jgi:predicted Zn-dependent protease
MDVEKRFEAALRSRDQGDYAAAQAALEELLPERPGSTALHAALADVYWEQGKLPEAVACFRRATTLNPTSETASLGLFHCLWEMGRQEEALGEMDRFLKVADCPDYREILAEINATPD